MQAASAFREPHSLVVSHHEPLEHLPSEFCCVPKRLTQIGIKCSWVFEEEFRSQN